MIYVIMISLSVVCAFVADKIKRKDKINMLGKLFFMFLAFLVPFLISALRDISIGTDTNGTYYEIYLKVLSGKNSVRDVGYLLLNKICLFFSTDFRSVLVLTSLLVVGFAYWHIFSKSKYPAVSTFLFFAMNIFFISMNMVRQSIATMIFIFAIPSIKEKNFLKYLIICIIAFSIHFSSILYIPLYFLCNRKIDFKKMFIFLLLIFVLKNFICDNLFGILVKIPYFQRYLAWYFTSSYNTGDISLFSLLISIAILFFLYICNRKKEDNFELTCITWMQILSFIFLAFSGSIPMMQRTAWLFSFPLFIYLPQCFDSITNKKIRLLFKIGICVGYALYMIITIFIFQYNQVYPYYSMFR